MSKRITNNIIDYLPTLRKSSTWEDAFGTLQDALHIESEFYDKIDTSTPEKTKSINFSLIYTGGETEKLLTTLIYTGEEYNMINLGSGEYDWDYLYRSSIDWCIKNKILKKPRKTQKKTQQTIIKSPTITDDITELKRERDRITMKIWAWKKTGKDTTELEKEKTEVIKKIKQATK